MAGAPSLSQLKHVWRDGWGPSLSQINGLCGRMGGAPSLSPDVALRGDRAGGESGLRLGAPPLDHL